MFSSPVGSSTLRSHAAEDPDAIDNMDSIMGLAQSLSEGITADRQTELWVTTMYRDLGSLNLGKTYQSLHVLPGGRGWIGAHGFAGPSGLHLRETLKPSSSSDGRIGSTKIELLIQPSDVGDFGAYTIEETLSIGTGQVSSFSAGNAIATILKWLDQGGGTKNLWEVAPRVMNVVERGADIVAKQTPQLCGDEPCLRNQWTISLNEQELVAEGRKALAVATQDLAGVVQIKATVKTESGTPLVDIAIRSDPMRLSLDWTSASGVITGKAVNGSNWYRWNPIKSKQDLVVVANAQLDYAGIRLAVNTLRAQLVTQCTDEHCGLDVTLKSVPNIQFSGTDGFRSAIVKLADDVLGFSKHSSEFAQVVASGPNGQGSSFNLGVYRASNLGWSAQQSLLCALPDNDIIRFVFALLGGILPTPEVVLELSSFAGEVLGAAVDDYQHHRYQTDITH